MVGDQSGWIHGGRRVQECEYLDRGLRLSWGPWGATRGESPGQACGFHTVPLAAGPLSLGRNLICLRIWFPATF